MSAGRSIVAPSHRLQFRGGSRDIGRTAGCNAAEDRVEIACYIAKTAAGLAGLAGDANLDLLAYFLSLAHVEAEAIARRGAADALAASHE